MSKNLELWNKLARPPREALKTIKGGRLSGMTDVNPQWRLKVMTETFGPCGQGWTYTIDKLWTEPGPAEQVMAFAMVSVKVGTNAPIQGIGGSMLVARETAGLRANDEGYKMAVTDALSTALKTLGVAADIYAGLWDGTKYAETPREPHKPSDGAWDHVSPERAKVIRQTVDSVRAKLEDGNDFDAYGLLETSGFDNEEKIAAWTLLDSKERSRLKKAKAEDLATQA
jgi:hypothetical protein